MVKRAGRLLTGRDRLYRYEVHPRRVTLGTTYGGWTIAPEHVSSDGVMYSFGVGNDISFDVSVISTFRIQVHAFDPTPEVATWISAQPLPPGYLFHPYGLGVNDGAVSFFTPSTGGMYSVRKQHANMSSHETLLPVRTLESIAKSLGTSCIDLLKMDIEGAEYDVLPQLLNSTVPIKQLLIEFHHRAGVESLDATVRSVDRLREAGFALFHVSETSSEFSFLNQHYCKCA